MTTAEERLMVAAAQDDPAKFADLYEIHFEQVYAFIASRVRDRDMAEDLTSDVFHKALANLRHYEWRGAPFAAWLIRIAANAIADQSKRAATRNLQLRGSAGNRRRSRARPGRNRAPRPPVAPGEPASRATSGSVIQQRFVEQRSIREIARQLGRSEGAVKQLQFRALQSLRAQMEGGDA